MMIIIEFYTLIFEISLFTFLELKYFQFHISNE